MQHSDPTVGELSEREVLAAILDRLPPSQALVGPGDDAAVLDGTPGPLVATVDTLVHGPDFRLAWTGGFDLGWKAAAVNLADVAAMGARPTALLVALAMPDATRLSFVRQLADGLAAACAALAPGCAVEGGDLTVSDTLTVAVTALGVLAGRAPVRRSGAVPGDVLALAGDAGLAAAGLEILFARFRDEDGEPVPVEARTLDAAQRTAVAAQLRPHPPIALGQAAARAGAHAMMDVSDGLALDAARMADASAVTVDIDAAALAEGGDPAAVRRVLSGGEDHALLAAFPGAVPDGFRRIGRILPRADAPVTVDGAAFTGRGGWDPYRDWDAHRG